MADCDALALERHPPLRVAVGEADDIEASEFRPHGASATQPTVESSHVTPIEGRVAFDQPPPSIRGFLPIFLLLDPGLDHLVPLLFERQVKCFHT